MKNTTIERRHEEKRLNEVIRRAVFAIDGSTDTTITMSKMTFGENMNDPESSVFVSSLL